MCAERRLALWLCCVRCCTAGAGQRVLCGSVVAMAAAFDAAAWLGGVHEDPELPGQSVQLRPKIVEILEKGFADGIFDKDYVTRLAGTGLTEKAEKDWQAFYVDAAKALKPSQLESHKRRLVEWLAVQYPSKDDGTAGKDGKTPPEPVSEAEKADIDAQGLSGSGELRSLELCTFLGRPVSHAELDGGKYEGDVMLFKIAKEATKRGDQTLRKVIEECKKTSNAQGQRVLCGSRRRVCAALPALPPRTERGG